MHIEYVYTYIHLCLLKMAKKDDNQQANGQTFVSDIILKTIQSKQKYLRFLEKVANSRTSRGKIQGEPGTSCKIIK